MPHTAHIFVAFQPVSSDSHMQKSARLHFHPRFSIHLSITETMILLGCLKALFYYFFPSGIYFFYSSCVPDVLTQFHVRFPDMPAHHFYMILALGTLTQIRTVFASKPAAFIFTVTIPVCCTIFQCFIVRTDITIIVFIIYVFMFSEESSFGLRTFVWEWWLDSIIDQQFCNGRRFVSGISYKVYGSQCF